MCEDICTHVCRLEMEVECLPLLLLTLFVETGFSLNLEITVSDRLAMQGVPVAAFCLCPHLGPGSTLAIQGVPVAGFCLCPT